MQQERYTPVVGTLGYVVRPDTGQILLVHRIARQGDHHFGKYNGLGGKMRADEDVATCMKREIWEEAGIEALAMQLRGTVSWPGFGHQGEDWLGFIFLITEFRGKIRENNEEGRLGWYDPAVLDSLPMWEGDRHFLPLVFDGDPRIFHGVMPYHRGRPVSWSYVRI